MTKLWQKCDKAPRRAPERLASVLPDGLHITEFTQTKVREFATKAALLHAAKRHPGIAGAKAVDKDTAAFQTCGHLQCPGFIGGKKGRRQTKVTVVCEFQRMLSTLRYGDRRNRPELFFAKRRHVRGYVSQHRGRIKVTGSGRHLTAKS